MKPSKRSNRPKPKIPTLAYLQELERKSREKTYDGEMAQFHVLEWLRLESLALADLSPPERQYHQHDLTLVKTGHHHWLIGCGPRPKGPIVTRGLPLFQRRKFAVLPLPFGQPNRDPNRVALSIDPLQPWEEVLMPEVGRHVSGAKERMFHRKRARGGGRPLPLAKMWGALQLYAKWQQDAKGKQPKTSLKLYFPANMKEHQGHKLMPLARRMIEAAKAGSHAWAKAFPIR